MSANKQIVEKYLEGFRRSDHAMVLECLTDDVQWVLPGAFHITGKVAFDKEIESDCFVGSPQITTLRMVEENDVVIAEGTVRTERKEGGFLNLVFCDVFEMERTKIKKLTTYLVTMP